MLALTKRTVAILNGRGEQDEAKRVESETKERLQLRNTRLEKILEEFDKKSHDPDFIDWEEKSLGQFLRNENKGLDDLEVSIVSQEINPAAKNFFKPQLNFSPTPSEAIFPPKEEVSKMDVPDHIKGEIEWQREEMDQEAGERG